MSTRWSKAPRATARDVRPLVALPAVPTRCPLVCFCLLPDRLGIRFPGRAHSLPRALEHGHRAQGAPAAWSPSHSSAQRLLQAHAPSLAQGVPFARVTRSGPPMNRPRRFKRWLWPGVAVIGTATYWPTSVTRSPPPYAASTTPRHDPGPRPRPPTGATVVSTGAGALPPIGYQPVVPGPPLNGPVTAEAIQPP